MRRSNGEGLRSPSHVQQPAGTRAARRDRFRRSQQPSTRGEQRSEHSIAFASPNSARILISAPRMLEPMRDGHGSSQLGLLGWHQGSIRAMPYCHVDARAVLNSPEVCISSHYTGAWIQNVCIKFQGYVWFRDEIPASWLGSLELVKITSYLNLTVGKVLSDPALAPMLLVGRHRGAPTLAVTDRRHHNHAAATGTRRRRRRRRLLKAGDASPFNSKAIPRELRPSSTPSPTTLALRSCWLLGGFPPPAGSICAALGGSRRPAGLRRRTTGDACRSQCQRRVALLLLLA